MSDDAPLKSSFDLAMERLRAKDRQEGVEEDAPLSDEQKAEIARLRQEAKAKLAEMEILHRRNRAEAADPEEAKKIEEGFRIDRERVESRLASAIAKVKRGRG